MKVDSADENMNDFASLFEESLAGVGKLKTGQLVETQIVSISKDCVFLQLNGKSEGMIDRAELTDKDGQLTVKIGDTIKAFFVQSKTGEMQFTTKIAGENAGPAALENAFTNQIPVEGLVEKEVKGGYEVKIGDTRAFCPHSQMGAKRTDKADAYVGKTLTFKIQEYKDNGRKIIVSNRAIAEEARQEHLNSLKTTLKENTLVKGTITSLQDFGAFVDLHGVQALLPVSEIGRNRVEDIRSVLTVGQEIEALIIKIDWSTERITLSLKSLLLDPWKAAAEKYPKGSKHTGKVVRLTDFGAFVSLESGLDGLVHKSTLLGDSKYADSGIALKVGQSLSVQVLDVDTVGKRISLKPATSAEEDATSQKYLDGGADSETYNPFAALLKKKK